MNHTGFYHFDTLTIMKDPEWCDSLEASILYRTSENNTALTAIAIDSKGRRMACGTTDAEIILIDMKEEKPQSVLTG